VSVLVPPLHLVPAFPLVLSSPLQVVLAEVVPVLPLVLVSALVPPLHLAPAFPLVPLDLVPEVVPPLVLVPSLVPLLP
jgi:hypothetical protein